MPGVPRIYRVDPVGLITDADPPIPVIATLTWMTARSTQVEALAVAWTSAAVQIRWTFAGAAREDWISAGDVRRPGEPPKEPPPTTPRPATRHRPRW